jgi:hypothetical protein
VTDKRETTLLCAKDIQVLRMPIQCLLPTLCTRKSKSRSKRPSDDRPFLSPDWSVFPIGHMYDRIATPCKYNYNLLSSSLETAGHGQDNMLTHHPPESEGKTGKQLIISSYN